MADIGQAAARPTIARRPAGRPAEGSKVGDVVAVTLLGVVGFGSGASAIVDGFYDLTVWGPIALGVFALAVAAAATTSARPRLVPLLAVMGLTGLWLWSWLSARWAESSDQAVTTAGRWALYAALLAALLLLMRRERERWIPLVLATIGIVAVAGYVLIRMLDGDTDALFFGGRLRDPLGYVNGQAGYFLLGFWPCVALAEQERSRLLAGLGAACALLLGSLLVLSQTRGVLPAVAASGLVVLLLVPGRPRRIWALAAIGVGLVLIAGPLLDVYRELGEGEKAADPERVKTAARRILLTAVVVGVAWGFVQALLTGAARGGGERFAAWLRRGEGALAAGLVAMALVVTVVAVGDPIGRVEEQYDDFVSLRVDGAGETRFLSGGGYRYDYWRVAWLEFEDAPLSGQGAGNYDDLYFAERRTSEDIRQPHSLPMQTLAELGLVGVAFLFLLVGAVFAGFWRQTRRSRELPVRRTVAVAGGGAFAAWLAHTSVDWLHNIPGVSGVALCAAAALVAPWARGRSRSTSRRIVTVALVGVAAVAAADSVGRLAYGDKDRIEARDSLRTDPVKALRLANRSLAVHGDSVPAMYVKAAAYARLGRYREARATLLEAVAAEPRDHLTWALLGDLQARRGKYQAAKTAYRRSLALNPRNPFIRPLAQDPRRVLGTPD